MTATAARQYSRAYEDGAAGRRAGQAKTDNPHHRDHHDGAIAKAWAWERGWEDEARAMGSR